MKIDVRENLINAQRNSNAIESEMDSFLETEEGKHIQADIELLNSMGFDKKMVNKVYILLGPANIERAIDYMTEIDGVYQHDFISSTKSNEDNLCFICKKPPKNHLDYIPENLLIDAQNNNQNDNEQIIQNIINREEADNIIIQRNQNDNKNDIKDNDDEPNYEECQVCFDVLIEEDYELNKIPCGHLFCTNCWFNYLKTSILEAKVDKIKCMDVSCKEIMSEEFILKHISKNDDLVAKYDKFKKRSEIIKDKNKKICPKPDCDSFLQKSKSSKYVKCEKGHEYCFECLKPPHGKKACEANLETQFMKWTKGKRVKRCPRCQMYTEKNEGCNHMTCVSCKYQWCWLCEGEYSYGHYKSGKCQGQQFTRADNLKEIEVYRNAFGLHKIFRCVYAQVNGPFDLNEYLWVKYLLMFGFLIFGYGFLLFFVAYLYIDRNVVLNDCDTFFNVILIAIGLCLFVCFQFLFTCTVAPFILISLVYHKFFDRLLIFYGIGENDNL